MAREITPGVVQLDDADLTAEERALVAWAEGEIRPAADRSATLTGAAAAAAGAEAVAAAIGGAENLDKALRGRPALDPRTPGRSPVRQVRMPAQLSQWLDDVATEQGRRASELIREAVGRYLAEIDPSHTPERTRTPA